MISLIVTELRYNFIVTRFNQKDVHGGNEQRFIWNFHVKNYQRTMLLSLKTFDWDKFIWFDSQDKYI